MVFATFVLGYSGGAAPVLNRIPCLIRNERITSLRPC